MQPTRPGQPYRDERDERDDQATELSQISVPLRPKQARRDRNIVTPFGELLTQYIARKRPIWSTGRLGRKLGIRRQTVANWVYHDITPPIEVMLTVLAKLDIPISELVKAYQSRGVAVPILAPPEELEELAALSSKGKGQQTQPTTQPRVPSPEEAAKAWDDMIAQTRAVMLATGFPEQALDALLATLRRR
jgi:DNA-binding XRE family transcriptional regulator